MAIDINSALQKNQSLRDLRRQGANEQEIIQFRKAKNVRNQQLGQQAQKVKKNIQSNFNKFSNTSQIKSEINKLPQEVKSRINADKLIKQVQDKNKKTIKDNIERAKERIEDAREDEKRAKDRDNDRRVDRARAQEDRYRTEKRELEKILKRYEKGEILDVGKALNFAQDKGRADERRQKAKQQRRKAQKDIAQQLKSGAGYVSGINFKTGKVKVDGKEIKLRPSDVKDLELTAITNSKNKKRINKIRDKVGKGLTVGELKKQGLSMDDITLLGAVETEFKALQEEAVKKNKKLEAFNKLLQKNMPKGILNELNFNEFQQARRNIRETLNQKTDITLPKVSDINPLNQDNFQITSTRLPTQNIEANSDKGMSLGELGSTALNFFAPILRKENKETASKIFGEGKVSRDELSNLAVDSIATIPLVKAPKVAFQGIKVGGKAAVSGVNKGLTGLNKLIASKGKIKISDDVYDIAKKKNTKIGSITSVPNRIKNVKKSDIAKFVKDYSGSVVSNVALADSVTRGAEKEYGVDKKFLDQAIKKNKLDEIEFQNSNFKIKNDENLYSLYRSSIAENSKIVDLNSGKVTLNKPQYYLNFIGLDTSTQKAINQAQRETTNFLINNGVSEEQAAKIVANLENKRRASLIGDIVGNVVTEFSSEALGQNLLKRGIGKKTAVFTAGTREALAEISKEAYIRDTDINPIEFAALMGLGGVASIYYSKQKFKNLKTKKRDKILRKASEGITNNMNLAKKNNIVDKNIKNVFKKSNLKVPASEVRSIRNKLTKPKQDKLVKKVVFNSLKDTAEKGGIKGKEKLTLRSIVANISEPFEIAGDLLQEFSEVIARNSGRKYTKKVGAKSFALQKNTALASSKGKGASKTKPATKGKSKPTTKSKAKPSSKSKATTKTKAKPTTKTKSKTKAKATTKPATKINVKSKAKSKAKTKVRTVTKFPPAIDLPKTSRKDKGAFLITFKEKGKQVNSKSKFPKNRAIKRGIELLNKNKNIKDVELLKSGKTNIKDIGDRTSKKYKINQMKTKVVIKRNK